MTKKIKIILTVSVLLNLVFIGFIGSHAVHFARMRMMMEQPGAGLNTAIKALPADKAELFVQTFKDLDDHRKGMFKNMEDTRKAIREAMLIEPFNADAVRKAFDGMETPRKYATEKIIALAEKLNVEERKLLVDYFEKNMIKPMKRIFRDVKNDQVRMPGEDNIPPPPME